MGCQKCKKKYKEKNTVLIKANKYLFTVLTISIILIILSIYGIISLIKLIL